jgi:hypothetical protein
MIADLTLAVIEASSTAPDIWLDVVGAGVVGAIAVCGGLVLWLDVEGGVLMFWLVVDGVR